LPPIEQVFQEIVSQLPGYEVRAQQLEMARTINRAISEGKHALIEAGTGSGKSFGYLVPLLEAGKRAVIATGTIALQEQLLHKDIPFLAQAYGREIRVALAKGRGNYVCLRKLEEAHRTVSPGDPDRKIVDDLVQISHSGTWNGDRAELGFVVPQRLWRDTFASDPEDCLGPRCPNVGFTPHRMARMEVDQAQIVVANHALYFADLALGGGVLPPHDIVVFDEAHHLDRAAAQAFSLQLNRWMTQKLLQRIQRRFSSLPPGLVQNLVSAEDDVVDYLFRRGRGQFRLEAEPEFSAKAREMSAAMLALAQWLGKADVEQLVLLDADPGTARMRAETVREQMTSVATQFSVRWEHFAELGRDTERANWMVVDPHRDAYELNSAPLHVGDPLSRHLWSQRTAVLTSATLAVDGGFDFVRQELGLPGDTLDAVLGSPFDFRRQALLYVPRQLPLPEEEGFLPAVCDEVEQILAMTRGRAFVLCTSYRAMREISQSLAPKLAFPCRTQDDLPRSRLIEWFKSTSNSILFATATFWEGVDVPGEALSCVIIDKLPFASPDDPIVQARTELMKARGEDWFGGYMLPRAVLTLKQGFGRLIRTRTDTGLVAILDRRLTARRYGDTILRSLPPARRLRAIGGTLEGALQAGVGGGSGANVRRGPGLYGTGWAGQEEPLPVQDSWNAPPPDWESVLGAPRED
jgi:ATP-dependent DNA helicase DinG